MIDALFDRVAFVEHWQSGGDDELGNAQPETAGGEEYPCRLAQMSSSESLGGQDRVSTDWTVFLPARAIVEATDRITIDGQVFEVVGLPETGTRPAGGADHVEARLQVISGG